MSFAWRTASFFLVALTAMGQTKSRDLKYEENRPAVTSATIPRGYALIVGVAGYKNLPANAQLEYSERDADAVAYNRSLLDLSRSMFSLTASRDRERSFESKDWGGGHGIFTYYVVKGLEGAADENGDGVVTADELADYARRNVREATKGQQNPTSDRGSFDPNMLLAYLPNGLRVAHAPPPVDGTLIFETNMDGVEVFVDGVSRGIVNKGGPLRLPGMRPGSTTI